MRSRTSTTSPIKTAIGAQILRASARQSRLGMDRPVVALRDLGLEAHGLCYGIATGRPSASTSGAEKTQSTWIVDSLSPP